MIVFDLRCGGSHVFEAWFGSSGDFDDQRARGLIACPICGDAEVSKAVMAPNIPTKGNRGETMPVASPETMKAMMAALASAQAKALESSEWVGRKFSDRARSMHLGEEPHATIHGEATRAEAKALAEEGIAVAPLPLPVVPPEQRN